MQVKSLPRRNGDTCRVRPNSGCQRYAIAAKRKLYVECRLLSPTPAEDIEIAGMGIALQTLLNRQSQALHAAAHVRVPSGDPDPDAARYRDHRRLRTSRTRPNASASTFSSTLTRLPSPSSISIRPRRFRAGIAAGASIVRRFSAAAAAT